MAAIIVTPCYANRQDVQRAPDFKDSIITDVQIDRALQSVSRVVEGQLHRLFYPTDTTYYWDWPSYQYAAPWRLWLDQWDIITLTALASPIGTSIPVQDVILYPLNRRPGWPYTRLELDRSTTAAFQAGGSPQKSIAVTGTFGFTADSDQLATLTAAISSTTANTLTVSDSSQVDAGDMLIIDTERLIVQDGQLTATTQTNLEGVTTASAGDNTMVVTDGTQVHTGEILGIDSEQMLILSITGNVVTVRRAWQGTVLATHNTGTTIYSMRLLTVLRGQCGTTAATHSNAAPVNKLRVPSLIRDLTIAEAVNRVVQETAGYSNTEGEGANAIGSTGAGLADLWDEAVTLYGRKARVRAI